MRPDIVFFTHYFPPEGNAPASRTYEHCVRWAAAGLKITVITCVPNVPNGVVYPGYRNRIWPQREMKDGIEVIRAWTYVAPNSGGWRRILNYLSYLFSAIWIFLFFCRRPRLVIATSPQFFCGWAGVISSWLKWTPFLLEIRDIWPESITTVGAMRKGMATRFLEVLERWMYLSANRIVAVGQGYREKILIRAPQVESRTDVITNGVDLNQFQPEGKSPLLLEQFALKGRFVCAYVGTIGMAHGLEIVLRAAARLKARSERGIVYLLVGDGADRERLESESRQQGLTDWVVFTGRLPKEQMNPILATADCLLVHLKKSELFETVIPSKIFESMAMERPIIMGVRGEAAEIVKRGHAGLEIEPEADDQLDSVVTNLKDDPELYRSLCRDGRQFVAENYSRDALAARFLRIIRDLTKTP